MAAHAYKTRLEEVETGDSGFSLRFTASLCVMHEILSQKTKKGPERWLAD